MKVQATEIAVEEEAGDGIRALAATNAEARNKKSDDVFTTPKKAPLGRTKGTVWPTVKNLLDVHDAPPRQHPCCRSAPPHFSDFVFRRTTQAF